MARKKSNDNAGALGFLLFAALATLITFASAVYGVVVLVAWNYYNRKSSRIPDDVSDGYFIATRKERREIIEMEQALSEERQTLNDARTEGKHLSKRSDDQYDERSSLGKRLNKEITEASHLVKRFSEELAILNNYSNQRREYFIDIKAKAASWKKAGITYLIAILCFLIYTPEWVAGLNQFLNKSGWLGQVKFLPMMWGILAASALVGIVVQQVLKVYYKYALENKLERAEKPPKHAAIVFTEMLAFQSEIGLCEVEDFERAATIFEEREASQLTHINKAELPSKPTLAGMIETKQEIDLHAVDQIQPPPEHNERPLEASSALPTQTENLIETATEDMPPLVMKRPLWKRLLTSVAFCFFGVVAGFFGFGLSGQGNFGTVLVLTLPLIGLVWGFKFRKFSKLKNLS